MIVNSQIKKQVLMCAPTYFEVVYDINPMMKETLENNIPVDPTLAMKQWKRLGTIYAEEGFEPVYIQPVKGLPDMVFTANAGFALDGIIVMGNFKFPERKPETEYFYKWFVDNDYGVVKIDEDFEGGGDSLIWKDKFIGGHGFRSDLSGVKTAASFASFLGKKLVPLKLTDPRFYHLDTCFCPLGERALYFPQAISPDSCEELARLGEAIPVSEEDALLMVCNGVYLEGKNGPLFVVNGMSDWLKKEFRKWGIRVIINKTSEFQKSGGSNRCLTLFL